MHRGNRRSRVSDDAPFGNAHDERVQTSHNVREINVDTASQHPDPPSGEPPGLPTRRLWIGSALATAALIGSGFARRRQDQKIEAEFEATRKPPFSLASIPLELGSWRGENGELPDEIARAAGSTDNIIRKYTDSTTGVSLSALVIVGTGPLMVGHPPENCYIVGSGYTLAGGPQIRLVKRVDGKPPVPYVAYLFERRSGAERIRAEVYYTWRIKGKFTTDKGNYKQIERISDVYKIQTERRLNATEAFNPPADTQVGAEYIHPTELFLGRLTPAFERLFDRGSKRLESAEVSPR